ncbi:MAG: 4-alpha-glucanotransferase, partial [Frankiales bacterium]|nr:4-alpha-glucanotransferase [Frankiales bacterium]
MHQDLERLAAAHGVATSYDDWANNRVLVEEPAVVAALTAMGIDASSPEAVAAALTDADEAPWRRMLPPSVVVRAGHAQVLVRAADKPVLEVRFEDGTTVVPVAAALPGETRGPLTAWHVSLPELPLGWHT